MFPLKIILVFSSGVDGGIFVLKYHIASLSVFWIDMNTKADLFNFTRRSPGSNSWLASLWNLKTRSEHLDFMFLWQIFFFNISNNNILDYDISEILWSEIAEFVFYYEHRRLFVNIIYIIRFLNRVTNTLGTIKSQTWATNRWINKIRTLGIAD